MTASTLDPSQDLSLVSSSWVLLGSAQFYSRLAQLPQGPLWTKKRLLPRQTGLMNSGQRVGQSLEGQAQVGTEWGTVILYLSFAVI